MNSRIEKPTQLTPKGKGKKKKKHYPLFICTNEWTACKIRKFRVLIVLYEKKLKK